MTFILLNAIGQALERDGAGWTWTNGKSFATPLRIQDALTLAEWLLQSSMDEACITRQIRIVPDYHQRPPESL